MTQKLLRKILILSLVLSGLAAAACATALQELSSDISDLVERSSSGVVEVRAVGASHAGITARSRVAIGSGFVVDPAGYILTTGNVVKNAESLEVRFADGTTVSADLMGVDPLTDAAVIKVEKAGLTALQLGDSDSLKPGTLVVTINNQSGFRNSTSLGMVAGLHRTTTTGSDLIQVSATVGPGASGGPVIDAWGRVVGVTAAMFAPSTGGFPFNLPKGFTLPKINFGPTVKELEAQLDKLLLSNGQDHPLVQEKRREVERAKKREADATVSGTWNIPNIQGLPIPQEGSFSVKIAPEPIADFLNSLANSGSSGFAIPINHVKEVLSELKAGKRAERGFLGIVPSEKDGSIELACMDDGPAAKAGVKNGDILIKADGKPFADPEQFVRYMSGKKPGQVITLALRREGKELSVPVTLGARPEPKEPANVNASDKPASAVRTVNPSRLQIDLDAAEIADVASALTKASGKNVIVLDPQKIKKKVTVHLKSSTVEQALESICLALDCAYEKKGETYVIKAK